MKRILLAVAASVLVSGIAYAGNNTFFTSIGDQIFPFTAPTRAGAAGTIDNMTIGATTKRAATVTTLTADTIVGGNVGRYSKVVAVTGFSYTFGNNQTQMLFEPAGTLSSGTITMAPAPVDGAAPCFFSTQTVSSLTLSANAGQSINNAVSAMTANVRYCYTYSLSNTTWDRSQ